MMPSSSRPPTIELLLSERLHEIESPSSLRAHVLRTGFLKELRAQAEYSMEQWEYEDSVARPATGAFSLTPAGALNPLSNLGKCSSLACRLNSARAFARSIGLYVDYAVVPDVFTSLALVSKTVKPEDQDGFYIEFFKDLAVLRELLPLIESRIIRFRAPVHGFCPTCRVEADRRVANVVDSLVESICAEGVRVYAVRSKKGAHEIDVSSPLFVAAAGHTIIHPIRVSGKVAKAFDSLVETHKGAAVPPEFGRLLKKEIRHSLIAEVNPVLFDLFASKKSGSVLAAGSRIEALFLKSLEETSSEFAAIDDWEMMRELQLPWIEDLSVSEVVVLKQDASRALPRLRELLARRLSEPTGISEPSAVKALVRELREEAELVHAELAAWAEGGAKRLERRIAAVGLSLILYGLTQAGAVATILGAVMTTLATAHAPISKEAVETAKLRTRPAYVLVRAREILGQRR